MTRNRWLFVIVIIVLFFIEFSGQEAQIPWGTIFGIALQVAIVGAMAFAAVRFLRLYAQRQGALPAGDGRPGAPQEQTRATRSCAYLENNAPCGRPSAYRILIVASDPQGLAHPYAGEHLDICKEHHPFEGAEGIRLINEFRTTGLKIRTIEAIRTKETDPNVRHQGIMGA